MSEPIPTSVSLEGRIAGDPQLNHSDDDRPYVRVRVDAEQPPRRQADGRFEKQPPVVCELVAFGAAAETLSRRFRFGDVFVASGRLTTNTRGAVSFVARRIGHDAARTDYSVDRRKARVGRKNRRIARRAPGMVCDAPADVEQPIVAGRIVPDRHPVSRTA